MPDWKCWKRGSRIAHRRLRNSRDRSRPMSCPSPKRRHQPRSSRFPRLIRHTREDGLHPTRREGGEGLHPTSSLPPRVGEAGDGIERKLTSRWLVWLGGVTIALAGIFLVKYSIDQDWLNPSVRCALGVLGGVALTVAGEWWRRRRAQRAPGILEPTVIPTALSAAGIAMLYSSVYAAFALYDLIAALFAFVALAAISFLSFALALLHGRFIAVLGVIGGYLVPVLVSTGEGSSLALFSFLGALAVALAVIVRYRGWWEVAWLGLAGAVAWAGAVVHDAVDSRRRAGARRLPDSAGGIVSLRPTGGRHRSARRDRAPGPPHRCVPMGVCGRGRDAGVLPGSNRRIRVDFIDRTCRRVGPLPPCRLPRPAPRRARCRRPPAGARSVRDLGHSRTDGQHWPRVG